MSIRREALTAYFNQNSLEKEYAEKLDEAFDITFGSKHGDKSFWLAEPKTQTKERFGLQQEVLVIFSHHSETDARVLTTIENITRSPDFKHRVDKVLFILIHSGDKGKTKDLVKTDPDKVIVCFHTDEMKNPDRGSIFIRTEIAKDFGDIDLFGMSSPITSDRHFFGREKIVQELIVRATAKSQNSGVFGLRKTGKTSVLRAVERRIEAQDALCEYIDCHNPGIHAGRWWQVLENISERLSQKLQQKLKRKADVQLEYTEKNCGTRFSSDIRLISSQISSSKVLLLLDEIEYITPELSGALGKHWDNDFLPFWQTIRATHQEIKGNLVFIVSGVNPSAVEKTDFSRIPNPIFQLAPPTYLEPFETSSVRQMVRTLGRYAGITFEEDVYGYLTNEFGGHPFLIRLACSEVWSSLNKNNPAETIKGTKADFENKIIDINQRLSQPIRDILLSLVWWYPEEYELLQLIAEGEEEFVDDYISQDKSALSKFVRFGILKQENNSSFAIKNLKDFLMENGEAYKKEISPFVRTDITPELLPEIPDKARLAELFDKRVEVESSLRRVIVFYLGIYRGWNMQDIARDISLALKKKQGRPDPSALFVGISVQEVMNELYLLDLKFIICGNWEVFKSLFENHKKRFEMNMDTINIARRYETHTRPISDHEIQDFTNSYAWLHRHLSKVPS